MKTLFKKWQIHKSAKELKDIIEYLMHLLRMKQDLLTIQEIDKIRKAISDAKTSLSSGDISLIHSKQILLEEILTKFVPKNTFLRWFTTNFETLIVAVAVAMVIRAYFFQPFQIPTGSMQPTLYGVHCWESTSTLMDKFPLSLIKWIIFGERYTELIVTKAGFASPPRRIGPQDPGHIYIEIAGQRYRMPSYAQPHIKPGEWINAGTRIWSGIEQKGDHVFVNKIIWNFRRPKRGELTVFITDGIQGLPQSTYYIKRMIGKPGETIEIKEPFVLINGEQLREPKIVNMISQREGKYRGYCLATGDPGAILKNPEDRFVIDSKFYFVLGDNTHNSRDSRYWGGVPRENLIGPAFMVYWPISRRWGFVK